MNYELVITSFHGQAVKEFRGLIPVRVKLNTLKLVAYIVYSGSYLA